MSLTHSQAVDEIYGMVVPDWVAAGYVASFEQTISEQDVPTTETPWALFSIEHGPTVPAMGRNRRLLTRTVVLSVTIFTPSDNVLPDRYQVARVILGNLEGKSSPGGAWSRSVELSEGGKNGAFVVTIITAEMEYYEIKDL